jgi:hypothetical protein
LDLVPRRPIVLTFLLILAVGMIAGLEAGYHWVAERVAEHGGGMVATLDLAAKGSLGCWFSSLLLVAASIAAILIYTVRRHRTDDYQGRYRVWPWAAACWFLVATDQATGLRDVVRDAMVSLTGTALVGDGALWWVILYALLLGALGSRLVVDMRESWFSMGVLLGAAVVHSVVTGLRLGWIPPLEGVRQVMLLAGTEMVGNLMLFSAMILHARHVISDAEGLLPDREADEDEDLEDVEDSMSADGDQWRKIDSPHSTPQPVFQRVPIAQPVAASPSAPPTSDAISSPINRKLTKGEKKALRERLLRERRERERRGL